MTELLILEKQPQIVVLEFSTAGEFCFSGCQSGSITPLNFEPHKPSLIFSPILHVVDSSLKPFQNLVLKRTKCTWDSSKKVALTH